MRLRANEEKRKEKKENKWLSGQLLPSARGLGISSVSSCFFRSVWPILCQPHHLTHSLTSRLKPSLFFLCFSWYFCLILLAVSPRERKNPRPRFLLMLFWKAGWRRVVIPFGPTLERPEKDGATSVYVTSLLLSTEFVIRWRICSPGAKTI